MIQRLDIDPDPIYVNGKFYTKYIISVFIIRFFTQSKSFLCLTLNKDSSLSSLSPSSLDYLVSFSMSLNYCYFSLIILFRSASFCSATHPVMQAVEGASLSLTECNISETIVIKCKEKR